jgi:hypothetical protein
MKCFIYEGVPHEECLFDNPFFPLLFTLVLASLFHSFIYPFIHSFSFSHYEIYLSLHRRHGCTG